MRECRAHIQFHTGYISCFILFGILYLTCSRQKDAVHTNRLQHEKSPYLLRHADNPVNWYPWSREAFETAAKENKPVFLSIGYSTCHWCRVMEEESFSSPEVAEALNKTFIAVKVDREEMPDVDLTYMKACSLMADQCGWPLTLVLTPDKKPFYAGTYHPPRTSGGWIGLIELSKKADEMWNQNHEKAVSLAGEMTQAIQKETHLKSSAPSKQKTEEAHQAYVKMHNEKEGGFKDIQGFPAYSRLRFFLERSFFTGQKSDRERTLKTLENMMSGGIHDCIEGGFHRYTTDAAWIRPHFEKMLYDQALFSLLYMDAFRISENPAFRFTARSSLDFVLENMMSGDGVFYSSLDSAGETGEGSYYLFAEDELQKQIPDADRALFFQNYRTDEISLSYQTDRKFILRNIRPIHEKIPSYNKISGIRKILAGHRKKRESLFVDKKIQTNWNALMISALASGGEIFGDKKYTDAAERALEYFLERKDESGMLSHAYEGGRSFPGNLEDYAYLTRALLDLYRVTLRLEYLEEALKLNAYAIKNFSDPSGGFYFTDAMNTGESADGIFRTKAVNDLEIPSGNAAALDNQIQLYRITGDKKYLTIAEKSAGMFSHKSVNPLDTAGMISSAYRLYNPGFEIVLAGSPSDRVLKEMLSVIRRTYLPGSVLILKDSSDPRIENIAPHTIGKEKIKTAAAYVCRNFICRYPVTDASSLKKLITTEKNP